MRQADAGRAERRAGFVIVAVLWILAALAGLIGIYVAYAVTMAGASDLYLRRVRADAALSGALELAVYDLTRSDARRQPPVQGVLDYRIGELVAQVRYTAESRRLDLNRASAEELSALIADFGVKSATADRYAAHLLAWRSRSDEKGLASEALAYKAAGLAYAPRGGPFQSTDELWDVLELPPDVVRRMLPLVTVYGGRGAGKAAQRLSGEAQPLQAGRGAQSTPAPPAGDAMSDVRNEPGGAAGAQRAGPLKPTRFDIRITDRQGVAAAAEIVAYGARDGDKPLYVLSWRRTDDVSGQGPDRGG